MAVATSARSTQEMSRKIDDGTTARMSRDAAGSIHPPKPARFLMSFAAKPSEPLKMSSDTKRAFEDFSGVANRKIPRLAPRTPPDSFREDASRDRRGSSRDRRSSHSSSDNELLFGGCATKSAKRRRTNSSSRSMWELVPKIKQDPARGHLAQGPFYGRVDGRASKDSPAKKRFQLRRHDDRDDGRGDGAATRKGD